MLNQTRRGWILLLPFALGLTHVSAAPKPEGGREAKQEPRRREEEKPADPRPWFTKPAFLTAFAAVIAAVGGIIAVFRRSGSGEAGR
jgi:hypothetical protein